MGLPSFPCRIFLHDHNGNPNKTNGRKETCLHCVCMEKPTHAQFYPVQRKRLDCLLILLKWKGAKHDGEQEKVDMTSQDEVNLYVFGVLVSIFYTYNIGPHPSVNIIKVGVTSLCN